MFIQIKTNDISLSELGYLLRKNPNHPHVFQYGFVTATVIFPGETTMVHLNVEIDEGLYLAYERKIGNNPSWVSTKGFISSELLSSALSKTFSSTISGVSKTHQWLCDRELDLEVVLYGVNLTNIEKFFQPLGWLIETNPFLDSPSNPQFGSVVLKGKFTIGLALREIALLVSGLDDQKIMWIGKDDVERLLKLGHGWLVDHPVSKLIIRNHLGGYPEMIKTAYQCLGLEKKPIRTLGLQEERIRTAIKAMKDAGLKNIADIGCGEGDFVTAVAIDSFFSSVMGIDPSLKVLRILEERIDRLGISNREKVKFHQGAVNYSDKRLKNAQGAVLLEVIEHIDPWRLPMLERSLFGFGFQAIFITTPNREFNILFSGEDNMRHKDHRFEWTREEFQCWCKAMGEQYGYSITGYNVGEEVWGYGTPTQGMLFQTS
jgi:3' terminal RNA ribose 2'-O-methyltransferase Hen1